MPDEPEKPEFTIPVTLLRWLALIGLTVIVTILFLDVLLPFLSAIVMAAIAAALATPVYKVLLRRLRNSPALAALCTLLIMLSAVIAPLIGIAYMAAGEAAALTEKTVEIYEQISKGVDKFTLPEWFPFREDLINAWPQIVAKIKALVGTLATFFATSLSHLTKGTAIFFLNMFVFFYAMFFFLQMESPIIRRVLAHTALPPDLQVTLEERIVSVSRATIKGTLLIGIVQGALGGFGFWMAGIDGAIFWAVIMAVVSLIPGVGAPFVLLGGAVFLGVEGVYPQAIGLALWATLVVGTIDNILRPILVGRDAQLHDVYILIGTLGGLAAFGPVGLIFGPVLAGLFQSVWGTMKDLSEIRNGQNSAEELRQELAALKEELAQVKSGEAAPKN